MNRKFCDYCDVELQWQFHKVSYNFSPEHEGIIDDNLLHDEICSNCYKVLNTTIKILRFRK